MAPRAEMLRLTEPALDRFERRVAIGAIDDRVVVNRQRELGAASGQVESLGPGPAAGADVVERAAEGPLRVHRAADPLDRAQVGVEQERALDRRQARLLAVPRPEGADHGDVALGRRVGEIAASNGVACANWKSSKAKAPQLKHPRPLALALGHDGQQAVFRQQLADEHIRLTGGIRPGPGIGRGRRQPRHVLAAPGRNHDLEPVEVHPVDAPRPQLTHAGRDRERANRDDGGISFRPLCRSVSPSPRMLSAGVNPTVSRSAPLRCRSASTTDRSSPAAAGAR